MNMHAWDVGVQWPQTEALTSEPFPLPVFLVGAAEMAQLCLTGVNIWRRIAAAITP